MLLLLPTLGQVLQEVCRQGHLSGHLDLLVPTRRQVRLLEDAAVGAVSRHHREQPALIRLVVLVDAQLLVANSSLSQLDELVLVWRHRTWSQPDFGVLGAQQLAADHHVDVVLCDDGRLELGQEIPVSHSGLI